MWGMDVNLKKVVIASKNIVKLEAAEQAFKKMFPGEDFVFEGVSVASGVPEQPFSDTETYTGAKNRVEAARARVPDAAYWVSFEGGVEDSEHGLGVYAWALVLSADDKLGKGRSSQFYLPAAVAELVRSGMELGHADDKVFQRENSKQANGAIGILTNDVITRTLYYVDAAVLALIPHKNPNLY